MSSMTLAAFVALLLALLTVQASSSSSGSSIAGSDDTIELTSSSSSSVSSSANALTPIDTASSTSATFQLVDNVNCNSTVSSKIYVIYNKNRDLFDTCVNDAQYQIFPFLGTQPSAAQIKAIATSTACTYVLTGVELADFPQCTISGFPLKAAVETLLKIHVDLLQNLAAPPSAARFQEMMAWRKNVNLAKEAEVPYDGDSEMYKEYEQNLAEVLSNTSIRVLSDYTVQYQLASGSWVGGGDDEATVGSGIGTVSAGDESQVSDEATSSVIKNPTATTGNVATTVGIHSAVTVAGLFLSALLVA